MMEIMPRISESRRAQQRERIVGAMRACIMRQGLTATTMADVIAASGLSAGAIYGYFDSKDDILLAVAQGIADDRREIVEGLLAQDPLPTPGEMISALLTTLPLGVPHSSLIVQVWGEAAHRPEIRRVFTDILGSLHATMALYLEAWFAQAGRAEPAAEARTAARVVVALLQGWLVQSALTGTADIEGFAAGVDALISLDGPTAPPADG